MNPDYQEVYFTKAQLQYLRDRFPPCRLTPDYNERWIMWCSGQQEVISAVEERVR